MLYIVARKPPASALETTNTSRNDCGPACSVPCQLPAMLCAWATPSVSSAITTAKRKIDRMTSDSENPGEFSQNVVGMAGFEPATP